MNGKARDEGAIGGYFDIDQSGAKWKEEKFSPNGIALNTGRNAFEYILRARPHMKHIKIPIYTCLAVLEPLERLGIDFSFYAINTLFQPVLCDKLKDGEAILAINYFGICDEVIAELAERYSDWVIIDASQAFYYEPPMSVPAFYSPRKFFGVPDGGIVRNAALKDCALKQDNSWHRCSHLLKRIDLSAEAGYADYGQNEKDLSGLPLMTMSKLTSTFLTNVDYEACAQARRENYQYLHEKVGQLNELHLQHCEQSVPMVYPLLIRNGHLLREFLRNQRVYCAQYWPKLPLSVAEDSFEYDLSKNLVALPIDQRYNRNDMDKILSFIQEWRDTDG